MKVFIAIHITALLLASVSWGNVRTLMPKDDEIIEVRTALGIATLIEFPEPITQAIAGDQSVYRIEYSGNEASIKPLRSFARTNVFFFTAKKRYNLRLNVVSQNQAFYILYIKNPDIGRSPQWISLNRTAKGKQLDLRVQRMAHTRDGFVLFDIELRPKRHTTVQPMNFWIKQMNQSKKIHSLFLSSEKGRSSQNILVGISIAKSELLSQPLVIELKRPSETLSVEIPKETLWR